MKFNIGDKVAVRWDNQGEELFGTIGAFYPDYICPIGVKITSVGPWKDKVGLFKEFEVTSLEPDLNDYTIVIPKGVKKVTIEFRG